MEHEKIIEEFTQSLNIVLTQVVEKHPNPPITSNMVKTTISKNAFRSIIPKPVLDKTGQAQSSAITTDGTVSSGPGVVPPGIILEKNYTIKELVNGNQEIKENPPQTTELK
jgi:hypothetical protein